MRNDLFLIFLILTFRVADGVTSYLPAKGFISGLGEANPLAAMAIERWGFFWAFLAMTAIALGFVLLFVAATHLEEIRRAAKADYRGTISVKRFRILGLACLAFLSSLPLILNLALAIGLD